MSRATLDDLAADVETDLHAIRTILRRPIDAEIARGQLTGLQVAVLRTLVPTDGLTLKDLSSRLGFAHSTVSVVVDKLAARGLVRREPHPSDGRATRIVVTETVSSYVQRRMPKVRVRPVALALGRATPRERRAVVEGIRVLRRLVEGLDNR